MRAARQIVIIFAPVYIIARVATEFLESYTMTYQQRGSESDFPRQIVFAPKSVIGIN